MNTQTIPILIGVTGHRAIREADRPALTDAVTHELKALKARCPHSRLVMLNSLAAGADLLCAEAAEALGIGLIAVLPMEQAAYEADFDTASLAAFQRQIARAEQVFVAPPVETVPPTPTRDFAYRQAGIYLAEHAHTLLALWDGGEKSGCGTADVVDFALRGAYQPVYGAPVRSACAVLQIQTPRGDSKETAGTVQVHGDRAAWERMLTETDRFNALAKELKTASEPILPQPREADAVLDRAEALYAAADALSVKYAAQYRRILAAIAIVSTVITISLLLYNDAGFKWMIVLCGGAFLVAWGLLRFARRSDCHNRYIGFRSLAEGLRVQAFLRYAGCKTEAAVLLPWSQQEQNPWIAGAIRASAVGGAPQNGNEIRRCWVEAQRAYHERAAKKSRAQFKKSKTVVRVALILSISLYVVTLLLELLGGSILPVRLLPFETGGVRTAMNFILGGLSAATLFISNYYGRLSLSRAVDDHKKMARFYARLSDRLALFGQSEQVLVLLAREELIENGNWRSYRQDNAPELNL